MKLARDEEIVDQYEFSNTKDYEHVCILTTNRLVVKYKHKEETYPLNKINAVSIESVRQLVSPKTIIGILLGLYGISMLTSEVGGIAIIIALLLFALGVYLIIKGVKNKLTLSISQSGGSKHYEVKRDQKLVDFVDNINMHMS